MYIFLPYNISISCLANIIYRHQYLCTVKVFHVYRKRKSYPGISNIMQRNSFSKRSVKPIKPESSNKLQTGKHVDFAHLSEVSYVNLQTVQYADTMIEDREWCFGVSINCCPVKRRAFAVLFIILRLMFPPFLNQF